MQKLLLKLSPLFLLLFLFSCAKDNDLTPVPLEKQQEVIQAKHDDGKACDVPCRRPDLIHVNQITACSATVSWSFNEPVCGTFAIQLQNLSTGQWTYYDPVVSPFVLTGLDPCTRYTVGVSHITKQCASLPLQVSFETECEPCKKDCDIPCRPLDFHSVDDITTTGATVTFGHNTFVCGKFVARLKNNSTGTITYYDPAVSPLVLTGLDPCTSYTISVGHVTDLQACLLSEIDFTTECEEHCKATGADATCLHNWYITLTSAQHPGFFTNDPSMGYIDATNQVLDVTPGAALDWTPVGTYICPSITTDVYLKLWIDIDQDFEFEASEMVYTHVLPGGCCSGFLNIPVSPTFVFPNVEACGMRARFIISTNETAGPCDDVDDGQVVDFTVNSTEC